MEQRLYKAQTRTLFRCGVKIKIPCHREDALLDALFSVLEKIDRTYNSFVRGSVFDTINRQAGRYVDIDDETEALLRQILQLCEWFDGRYDITVMPLLRLWGFHGKNTRTIPRIKEIDAALKKVDYRRIELEKGRVRIQKGQEITTGSFLKAWAVDRVIEAMQQEGITDGLVNAGGSTIRVINDAGHPFWNIRTENFRQAPSQMLQLADGCFSVSSQQYNYIEKRGIRFGHILDPLTGFPAPLRQLQVITSDAFTGDVLSTGLVTFSTQEIQHRWVKAQKMLQAVGRRMETDGTVTGTPEFIEKEILKSDDAHRFAERANQKPNDRIPSTPAPAVRTAG